jgi:transposase InsO family protein
MEEYNHKRPHEALQNKTPMEYEAAWAEKMETLFLFLWK